jgi:uncharacterized protein (TIGR03437 family)
MLFSFRLLFFSLLVMGFSFAQSRLAVIPVPGAGNRVTFASLDPLVVASESDVLPDPFRVLVNPSGTRYYVLGRSGTVVVLNPAAGFTEVERYSLAGQITDARITPDGRQMIILAGELRIIDLSTDRPTTAPAVNVGALPEGVAISRDSRYAFAISSISRLISMVDLVTNRVVAQQAIPGTPRGIGVGPSGLLYVATTSRLFEIDGRDGVLNFTLPGGINYNGEGGELAFSPDGQRVIIASSSIGASQGLIVVDVRNRTATVASSPVLLRDLAVVSDSLAYALGNDGRVYQFSYIGQLNPGLAAGGFPSGVEGLAGSNEGINKRFLFAVSQNQIFRYDLLTQNNVNLGLSNTGGSARLLPVPSRSPIASLRATSLDVNQSPGGVSLPIAVQALDAQGFPVFDAPITFNPGTSGIALVGTTARTDRDGIAVIRGVLPTNTGNLSVRATSATEISTEILVRVATQSTVTSRFLVEAGQGQVISAGQLSQPLSVRLRDSTGNPVANTVVNFAATTGTTGITILGSPAITDANGIASVTIQTDFFNYSGTGPQFRTFAIDASVNSGVITGTLNFFGVVLASNLTWSAPVNTSLQITAGGDYELAAGGVFLGAFTFTARTNIPFGTPGQPELIPNVGIRASAVDGQQVFSCREPSVSNSSGVGSCDLEVGSNTGPYTLQISIGGQIGEFQTTYPVRVIPGQPSTLRIIQGDGQSGAPGTLTPRALVVEVQDVQGNPIRDTPIVWSVVSGSASLEEVRNQTDSTGRASALVRFGTQAGTITIRAATGGIAATFTLTNTAPVGSFTIVSGNNQSAPVNAQFAQPLVVQALDASGAPQPGLNVSFQVASGPATLSANTIATGSDGRAQVFVTAGAAQGPVSIIASLGGTTLPFSLTVTGAEARIDAILNGASFFEGASRCSVGVIRGSNLFPSLSGVVTASLGPVPVLPFTLSNVSVTVGGARAPIFYLSNTGGVEQIGIQVPCEAPLGSQTVEVTIAGRTGRRTVNVQDVQPGIFETEYTAGLRQGVAIKANGTYVSPTNPAIHGETITGFFTGLGPTLTPRTTNAMGIGQSLEFQVIVGVNNQGMPIVSASYAPNLIGVYQVQFVIDPAVAGVGGTQAYAVAIQTPTERIFGQTSTLPVRAQ